MKTSTRTGISLAIAVMAGTWIATACLGPAKLESQLIMTEAQEWGYMHGHSQVEVRLLHAWAPLYFEATTTVHKVRLIDGKPPNGKEWTKQWGTESTASYLYLPWRVYLLREISSLQLPVEGDDPAIAFEAAMQKAIKEKEAEEAARKRCWEYDASARP